ncbi:hypothetical protein LTS08_007934 [Lithohypha guttulata]|nr:hypothetical protein LTS08_007934 [Lithohypha guttulata]
MQHHEYPIRTQPDESEYIERHRTRLPTIVASSSPESHGSDGVFAQRAGPSLRPFRSTPDTGQVSPAETNLLAHDYYNAGSGATGVSHVDALGQVIVPNPKRAYRQRRKDPSCDACRERKVKCDATETTSCTECSSRNVRCQFTKDSNRRMSSIKQVQDLERQLVEARTQLDLIRASENVAEQRAQRAPPFLDPEIQDISRSPRRMLKARTPQDLSVIRLQLADVGRGVLRPPISPLVPDEPDHCKLPLSILPPRNIAQHCLDIYLQSVHKRCPIVNWPQFCERFWSLYAGEATSDVSREVITMSFAILGLGAYSSPDIRVRGESEGFVQVAFQNMNLWDNRFGANQGPVSLLLSIYMLEANMRSNSLIWLGCATRIAQDRGLHIQGGYWSAIDGEMRKRIWYSLYVCDRDRLVAMELGRPMLIADEDCDTEYPQLLEEEEYIADVFHPQRPTLLLASVHFRYSLEPQTLSIP